MFAEKGILETIFNKHFTENRHKHAYISVVYSKRV